MRISRSHRCSSRFVRAYLGAPSAFAQLGGAVNTPPVSTATGVETGSTDASTGVTVNTTADTTTVSTGGSTTVDVPTRAPGKIPPAVIQNVL